MIVEHRRYTLKPGCTRAFWDAQVARGFDSVRPILDRLVGYFEAADDALDEITHLYCFDGFVDWKTRLHGLYADPGLAEYFRTVRQLMTAQENKFLIRAPLDALNPVVKEGGWTPSPEFAAAIAGASAERLVEETTIQLFPGALPVFWSAYGRCLELDASAVTHGLLGCFSTLVGQLHQVVHYRTYVGDGAGEAHANSLRASRAWQEFCESVDSLKAAETRKLLRPSPLQELSPLFRPVAARGAGQ